MSTELWTTFTSLQNCFGTHANAQDLCSTWELTVCYTVHIFLKCCIRCERCLCIEANVCSDDTCGIILRTDVRVSCLENDNSEWRSNQLNWHQPVKVNTDCDSNAVQLLSTIHIPSSSRISVYSVTDGIFLLVLSLLHKFNIAYRAPHVSLNRENTQATRIVEWFNDDLHAALGNRAACDIIHTLLPFHATICKVHRAS